MKSGLTFPKWIGTLAVYALLFALALVVAPLAGSTGVSIRQAFHEWRSGQAGAARFMVFELRLPRVLLGLLAGGSLALAGAGLQVILRNPLAEPFTLGIVGGAAVGAVVAIALPVLNVAIGPFSTIQVLAMAGAGVALSLIYRLARRPHGISMNTLLLAGVTLSIVCSGFVLFIRTISQPSAYVAADRWMMGGLETIGYKDLFAFLPLFLPGVALLLWQAPALNHLSLDEQLAAGHGVNVARVQKLTFLGAGLVTAATVSVAGPIGFVGLIIPHAVRRVSGFDQRIVLPCSFLLGGAFLAACDAGAQLVYAQFGKAIPVGVVTAVIGGLLFIRILLGRRR